MMIIWENLNVLKFLEFYIFMQALKWNLSSEKSPKGLSVDVGMWMYIVSSLNRNKEKGLLDSKLS